MKDNKEIYKNLFGIVTLMASLVTASDAFMLGFLDQDSLSASSLAGQIAFVFSLFYGAFVFGLTVLAAQYWGKGDKQTAEEVLAITMRYSLLAGSLFTLGTLIFPEQIMHFFTSDTKLITAGGAYCVAFLSADRIYASLFRNDENLRQGKTQLAYRFTFGSAEYHSQRFADIRYRLFSENGNTGCGTCDCACKSI